jgi:hypothetical protein
VPCYVRWPARFKAGLVVDTAAAHIDVTPTVLEACGVAKPEKVRFDGRSLLPLLHGDKVDWPERTLYFQWHRGDEPERYRAFAARGSRWKLVQPLGVNGGKLPEPLTFELFDMIADPLERKNVAAEHPEIVERMRKDYDAWFADVTARGFTPPRIYLGPPQENPTELTRQDWRGPRAGWGADGLGYWEVQVTRTATYRVTLRFPALAGPAKVRFVLGGVMRETEAKAGATEVVFEDVRLTEGPGRLEPSIERDGKTVGVHYVEVRRQE